MSERKFYHGSSLFSNDKIDDLTRFICHKSLSQRHLEEEVPLTSRMYKHWQFYGTITFNAVFADAM